MIICGCLARGAALLFVVFGMGMATPCQDSNAASELNGRLKIQETKLYGEAHPYIEEPLPKLKKIVPELRALQPAANQEPLPSLLSKIGVKADELLQKIPDLISDEVVVQSEVTKGDAAAAGCAGCVLGDTAKRSEGQFNYIIIRHPGRDQRKIFEEYRSGRNGKPISPEVAPVRFQGFAATWMIFSSMNQAESRFRELGNQRMDGRDTVVVGFAQIPGAVESPGRILSGTGSIPMMLQGIAWVDQSDFRIVRLRTDLLAPRPEVNLQRQTASIQFGPVQIAATTKLDLWLPLAVQIEMESPEQHFFEQHKYSRYRLYQVKARMLPPIE